MKKNYSDKMNVKVHIGKLIEKRMMSEGHSVSWLARQLYCDRSNIYKIFQKQSLDTEVLFHVSQVLKTDFFAYYSDKLRTDLMQNP